MNVEKLIQMNPEVQKFNDVLLSSAQVEMSCRAVIITDETSREVGTNIIKKANDIVKAIDVRRKELVEPHLTAQREINDAAKLLSSGIEDAIKEAKEKLLNYQKEHERLARLKAEEEARKLQAEAKRKEAILEEINNISDNINIYIKGAKSIEELKSNYAMVKGALKPKDFFAEFASQAKLVVDLLPIVAKAREQELLTGEVANVDMTALDVINQSQQQIVEETKVAELSQSSFASKQVAGTTKGIRKTWKFKITDRELIPRDYLSVDDNKVKGFMIANKEELATKSIPGIQFYQEESIVLK